MNRPLWRQPEFWTTVAAVTVLTIGHYAAGMQDPFWHDLFRRLYYLPIILAGFRYGLLGGLVTSGAVVAAFLPHAWMTRMALMHQAGEAVFEVPLFLLMGAVTGILSDRQRKANESLRRAERLRTLGEMAAGMAHEVKNPLAAIRSSAQILSERVTGKEAEFAGIVVSEVDRLNRVVNEFLDYARPAPLRRDLVKVSTIIDSCLGLLMLAVRDSGIEVRKDYPEHEAPVSVDASQLRQVFLNLVLNAIQSAKDQCCVEVSVKEFVQETRVAVKDHGPGIPPGSLKRVFEPFFTTKPGGTGLGLPIAQRIVAEHGGRLMIESTPGAGTTATVVLPRG